MPERISVESPRSHRRLAIVDALFQTGLIVLGVVMALLGTDDPIYQAGASLLIVLILVLAPIALVATAYLLRLYWHDARRSWLLLRDALIAIRLSAVVLFLGALAVLRMLGYVDLPWAGPLLVVAMVIVAETPMYMAAVYWLRRRARGDGTPPPMND